MRPIPLLPAQGGGPHWAQQVTRGTYLPHIDGMRCLAVVPVLLFHLASSLCPAGFVGVDVFFVISGYLICGGIFRDLEQGTFSLRAFYFRRIRRIFPAYFTVMAVVLLVGLLFYHWARVVPLAQTALFSSLFSANLYFWLDTGYFQPNAHANALLNLWSLGVEEQFYIVIPVVTLLLWKLTKRCVMPVFLTCLCGSLAICLFLGMRGDSTTAFYTLPTRAWELFAGALISRLPSAGKGLRTDLLSLLGLLLLVASFWCLSVKKTYENGGTNVELILPFLGSLGIHPFPGWVSLPAVAGSLLLLHYGATGATAPLLGSPLFVGIGKISYSLYLWHWPVVCFARYVSYDHSHPALMAAAGAFSFAAAYLSWRFVELPFRLNRQFTPRRAFTWTALACGSLAALCTVLIQTEGLRHFLHQDAARCTAAPRPFLSNFNKFRQIPAFHPPAYPSLDPHYVEPMGAPGKPTFCLLGDSHAEALLPGLDRIAREQDQSGLFIIQRIHPVIHEPSAPPEMKLFEWIAAHPDIHDIYLVGRWLKEYRIEGSIPRLGEKGRIAPLMIEETALSRIESDFQRTAEWFTQRGKKVYLFTTVPEYGYGVADIAARSRIIPNPYPIELTRQDYENRQGSLTSIFSKLEQQGLVTIVPLHASLFAHDCSVYMSPEGQPYYSDGDHLTAAGATLVSRSIAPLLWPKPL